MSGMRPVRGFSLSLWVRAGRSAVFHVKPGSRSWWYQQVLVTIAKQRIRTWPMSAAMPAVDHRIRNRMVGAWVVLL